MLGNMKIIPALFFEAWKTMIALTRSVRPVQRLALLRKPISRLQLTLPRPLGEIKPTSGDLEHDRLVVVIIGARRHLYGLFRIGSIFTRVHGCQRE